MEDEFFQKLRKKIIPYFKGINSCHDMSHIERVLDLALHIGEKENADLEILQVSVLLHDIARKKQDESMGKVCHAILGAKVARKILKELSYDDDKIEEVVHCIGTHRFRESSPPKSIEAKVLFDCDKLDCIGAIGILRATSFSGFIGAVVHNPNIDINTTNSYSKEDCAYREFLYKLVKIKDKMMTESGKEFAKERHEFMVEFFNRVNKEVKGEL